MFDQSENDYERNGISACFSMVQAVSGAADMDDVDVKFRHTVEMAVSGVYLVIMLYICYLLSYLLCVVLFGGWALFCMPVM